MKFTHDLFIEKCAGGDQEYVNKWVAQHCDINYRNDKGWSAISVACYGHFYNIVETLLHFGADINLTNYKGTTVFMYAKTKCLLTKKYDFLTYLLNRGADINAVDNKGWSVLDYVEDLNDAPLIQYLKLMNAENRK